MRKAFTLAELVIAVVITGILVVLVLGSTGGFNNYSQTSTGDYTVVKTYTVTYNVGDNNTATSKRVDLRPESGQVETVRCDDNLYLGIRNSATLYAQFEPGKKYHVSTAGVRNEFWSMFPYVTNVVDMSPQTVEYKAR